MQAQFEKALCKLTRNHQHMHEVFQMAAQRAQRAPYDPIYIELSPGGFYYLTFGEVYDKEKKLSENIFIMVSRYSTEQMAYLKEHWDCPAKDVPGFNKMIEDLHAELQKVLDKRDKRAQEESQSEPPDKPLTALPRKGITRDDYDIYKAISNTKLI